MMQNETCRRKVYADYFLALFTREISGSAEVWRLYTHDEGYNALAGTAGSVRISGDLYATPDLKDVCGTYYPAIGPYDATDPDVAEYHVLLAKSAGIDGFMGEWAFEGMNRDLALLNLADAAERYGFELGVNWCEYGHFAWQSFASRKESIEAAKRGLLHLLRRVYDRCGAKVDGRPLVLLFDARSVKAESPKDMYFDPDDIAELRAAARANGYDPLLLTRGANEQLLGVADGFFKWMQVSGESVNVNEQWTMRRGRDLQNSDLTDFYEQCGKWQEAGKISHYAGAVWPGFDDHKGQAWGSGHKRYIPRDDGLMLEDSWDRLMESAAEIALIVTWNDWEEASHIEPSLELGYTDLEQCARRIAAWKQQVLRLELLPLPERLFRLRKRLRLLRRSGFGDEPLAALETAVNGSAMAISRFEGKVAARELALAETLAADVTSGLHAVPVHLLWEFSLPSFGMDFVAAGATVKVERTGKAGCRLDPQNMAAGLQLSEDWRRKLRSGCFAGKLCLEFADTGHDFIRVEVDADKETHRVIASFQKNDTGHWRTVTLDLVNARFAGGLNGDDIRITQAQSDTPLEIRLVRIDGRLYHV